MVTVRYIKKGGKLYGPYSYKSIRGSDGKVKKVYLGAGDITKFTPHETFGFNKFLFAFLAVFFLIGFAFLFQYFFNVSLTGNYVLNVDNKLVSSNSVLEVDGVSSPMPLELIKIGEDWYYNITTLDLNLSSGNHVVRVIDNSIIVFEQNVSVGDNGRSSGGETQGSGFGVDSFGVQGASDFPQLNFTNPTPDNNVITANTSFIANVSISSVNNLSSFVFSFNNTNQSIFNFNTGNFSANFSVNGLTNLTHYDGSTTTAVYDNSLVLMLNFENLSSLGENATYVVDMSKYGNNGTVIGGAIVNSTNGKYGGGVYFDGSDDYINFSNSPSLPNGTNPRSMCAWGLIQKIGSYKWIVTYGSNSDAQAMILGASGSSLLGGGYVDDLSPYAGFWSVNIWNHVCLTYNGTHGTLYGNGASLVGPTAKTWNLVRNRVYVGRQVNTGEYWNGSIDEVRIWNRSLSANEISDMYISNLMKYNSTQWYFYAGQSFGVNSSLTITGSDVNSVINVVNSTQWYFYANESGLGAGTYSYYAFANDSVGNSNQTETRTLTVIVPPTLTVLSPTAGQTITVNNVGFNISADQNLSSCAVSLDNYLTNYSMTLNASLTGANYTNSSIADGSYTANFSCNNTYNLFGTANVSFTINTIPALTVISPTAEQTINANNVGFNVSSNKQLSYCVLSLNNYLTNYTMTLNASSTGANYTNSSIADGSYTANFSCNGTNNIFNSTGVAFSVNTASPQLNFTNPTLANNTAMTNTFFIANVSIVSVNALKDFVWNFNNTNYTIYNDSLVLMYNFENLSSLGENATKVVDMSKWGNNGTVIGGAVVNSTNGKYGSGAYFDGVNDYVNVVNTTGNTPPSAVGLWLNSKNCDQAGGADNYQKIGIFVKDGIIYGLLCNNSKLRYYYYTGAINFYDSTQTINNNQWYHIFITSNTTGSNIYINGILDTVSSTKTWLSSNACINCTFQIGRNTYDGGPTYNYFNGYIDEFRIWNRSLTASEVYEQYASNLMKFNSTQWYFYVNQSLNATTGLGVGSYSYYAFANDTSGNSNFSETRTIIIDITNPTINFTNPSEVSGSVITRNNILVNVTAVDANLANITIRLYNSTRTQINSSNGTSSVLFANFTGLSDGQYFFNATAYDSAENINNTETRNVTIDASPPNIAVVYPDNNTNFSVSSVGVNYTVSDVYLQSCWWTNNSGLSNNTITCGANISSAFSDGLKTVVVYANDTANNINSSSVSFRVDTTAPSVSINNPAVNGNYSGNLLLNASVVDLGAGVSNVYFNVSNSTFSTFNKSSLYGNGWNFTFNTINYADGLYNVTVYANDTLGNLNNSERVQFRIDNTQPTISIIIPANNTNSSNTNLNINYTASDSGAGLGNCWYSNDTMSYNYSLTNCGNISGALGATWSEGQHNITIWVNDSANNINSTSVRFLIDTTPPYIAIITPNNNSYNSDTGLNINYTVSDTGVGIGSCWYSNDTMSYNYSLTNCGNISGALGVTWSEGQHNIIIWVNDTLNNINSTSIRFTIDTINPTINFTNPTEINNGFLGRTNIIINVTSTDINFANVTIRLYNSTRGQINSSNSTSLLLFANFTNISEGSYYFNATTIDLAGNANNTETRFITIDLSPPLISFGYGTNENYANVSRNWTYVNVSVTEPNFANITFNIRNDTEIINSTTFTISTYTINWTNLRDGNYSYNVSIYDTAGNLNSTDNRRIVIDTTMPLISFGTGTENNGANVSRNWTYVNITFTEANFKNITFSIRNDTAVINSTTFTTPIYTINWTGLREGNYTYNASIIDSAGNINSTGERIIVLDTTSPVLAITNRNNARQNATINLTANLSDNLSGLQSGIASVLYPNSTRVNYTMSLNSNRNMFNVSISNLSLVGDYIVNYTFNDSAGNVVYGNNSFNIFVHLNVIGNVTDAAGNLVNRTYRFYSPGTNTILYNFTGTSYNLINDEIYQNIYDVVVEAGENIITLSGLNLTTTYIPINIDSFTAPAVTNYKILGTIGINSSYEGNAVLNLSYLGLFDSSVSAINESNLTVHKCSSWNYTQRVCNGDFSLYLNKTIMTGVDRVIVNTTSFSSFLISEYTCGNDVCQIAYGETTSTCANDCVAVSPAPPSGGGGGGGGGGGATLSEVKKLINESKAKEQILQPLIVNAKSIERELQLGEEAIEIIVINNPNNVEETADIKVNGKASEIILVENRVSVKPKTSTQVPVKISGKKEGIYRGNVWIKDDKLDQSIPVLIIVKGKAPKLLDLDLRLDSDVAKAGSDLGFRIALFNFGQLNRYDINLEYYIKSKSNNKTYAHKQEVVAIETSLSLSRKIGIPKNLPSGDYLMIAKASYGETTTTASASFNVPAVKIPAFVTNYLPIAMSIFLILFLLIVGVYYYFYIKQKLFEKEMEEIKKKSIYVFPDFKKLPHSRFAYVGNVADTPVRTYLDHTQLNRHTLIAGGTGSGKTIAGMVIVEELLKKNMPVVVFDPVGQWTGFTEKNTDKTMRSKFKKFGLGSARDFKTKILEIDESLLNLDIINYMKNNGLTILVMNKLTPKKADLFVEGCLEKIYRSNLSETTSLKYLLVLDEVHRLLPKYGGHGAYIRLEQAVREFRKWGIGLLMISQVLTDFKGAIRGNIATEIQLQTRYEGDVKRVRERHGSKFSTLIPRLPVAIGMVESAGYNLGNPYFIEFRPVLHSPLKIAEAKIKQLAKKESPVLSATPLIEKKHNHHLKYVIHHLKHRIHEQVHHGKHRR